MADLFELTTEIAPLLKGKWRYNQLAEENERGYIRRALINDDTQPGRQVVLRPYAPQAGRIQIYGLVPNRSSQTKITVSEKRTARAIAGDINRRLLPGYLSEWEAAQQFHQKREAELDIYRHQVNLLRFVPGMDRQRGSNTLTGADEFWFEGGSMCLYSGGHKAHVRLSLSFDDLVRVMMVLYGERAQENGEYDGNDP